MPPLRCYLLIPRGMDALSPIRGFCVTRSCIVLECIYHAVVPCARGSTTCAVIAHAIPVSLPDLGFLPVTVPFTSGARVHLHPMGVEIV